MPRWCFALLIFLLAACSSPTAPPAATHQAIDPPVVAAATALPTITPTAAATATPRITPTATLPAIQFFEPAGCLKPSDEAGAVVEVNGWQLNERTLAMLRHAQSLYGGSIDLTGAAVTQGSYHDNGSASFGTHMGGGAVDLSIFLPGTWQVDFANLHRLLLSLRAAGFAAWVRSIDEVFPGSGWHIHAIALGDPQLSPAAQDQLDGPFGYLRGFNGLPQDDGVPVPDVDGAPLLCAWMLEMGYADLRGAAGGLSSAPTPPPDWQMRLRSAAEAFQTHSAQETAVLAAQLYTTPEFLVWVLPGALWEAAGLLPRGVSPADNPRTFAKLRADAGAFWNLFAPDDYEHLVFEDFNPKLTLPGDLIYLQAVSGGAGLPLVVIGQNEQLRPLTLLAEPGADGWRVRILSVDEVFSGEWAGYELLRYRGLGLPPGGSFVYRVQPGDTLPLIAARFNVSLEALIRANALSDPAHLQVGERLTVQK